VRIDQDLQDIVPVFLANRQKDLQALRRALAEHDFETIRVLGHRMKGDGGGYGFDKITEIGGVMELAAARRDHPAVERHTLELEDFLTRVQVVFR
jgi:HPt (histidine-containing phosphotransfer) domain-containing protein